MALITSILRPIPKDMQKKIDQVEKERKKEWKRIMRLAR